MLKKLGFGIDLAVKQRIQSIDGIQLTETP